MNKDGNIVLVGFMGTGKTTVGRILAKRLRREFVDMDRVIEERQGRKISDLFACEGEPFFRRLERDLVRELAARDQLVIGTGGGVVLNPDNLRDFGQRGLVVCLRADPDTILARVGGDSARPLLEGGEKREKIIRLLAARQALYEAVEHGVNTVGKTPAVVADDIIRLYEGLRF